MKNRNLVPVAPALLALLFSTEAIAQPVHFDSGQCEMVVTEPEVNSHVREVFENKTKRLVEDGILSDDFWSKNRDLVFSVCNNRASYDTFVVYGKGIVFDYHMIGFLFAQSRALLAGRYVSPEHQFTVHAELVMQFVRQGPELDAGPLPIIENKVLELGASKADFDRMTSDPEFQHREQKVFLQALYFLVMHERCHVTLDHGTQLKEIKQLDDADQMAAKHQLELDADRCALEIINSDESRYKGSPISFLGVLMTVATQSIVANHPALATQWSHPSTVRRISAATDTVLDFLSGQESEMVQSYDATIRGTADYFVDSLGEAPHLGRTSFPRTRAYVLFSAIRLHRVLVHLGEGTGPRSCQRIGKTHLHQEQSRFAHAPKPELLFHDRESRETMM